MFRNRDVLSFRRTGGMLLRTKARFWRTARKVAQGARGVRPFELYFLGVFAGGGVLLPAGKCGSERLANPAAIPATEAVATVPAPTPVPTPDLFASSVRPVLVARCSPPRDGWQALRKVAVRRRERRCRTLGRHSAASGGRRRGGDREVGGDAAAPLSPFLSRREREFLIALVLRSFPLLGRGERVRVRGLAA